MIHHILILDVEWRGTLPIMPVVHIRGWVHSFFNQQLIYMKVVNSKRNVLVSVGCTVCDEAIAAHSTWLGAVPNMP